MPLRDREVAEQLNLRQFSQLCNVLDEKHGTQTKFSVVSIKREPEKLYVVVCMDGGILHTVELAA